MPLVDFGLLFPMVTALLHSDGSCASFKRHRLILACFLPMVTMLHSDGGRASFIHHRSILACFLTMVTMLQSDGGNASFRWWFGLLLLLHDAGD
jgi:hypothetical protein